ncbi:MAG: MFS transporter [bacterium]|nr:MFS transporter [bacterium]
MSNTNRSSVKLAIIVAALGYFVDVYDLLLFSIVRVASLRDLGVPENELLSTGVFLLNSQMAGLLLGGIFWGILGDKKGRISVLFGSIILYSVGNILNGFVTSVNAYAGLRFLTGIGLAGELGAGITLVSEIMPAKTRGYATTFIASVGVAGAIAASLIGEIFTWRISFFIGGGMGLALLILRVAVVESGLFDAIKSKAVKRGDLLMLFASKERFLKYLSCIAIGVPIWYAIGIIITFSPEIGKALQMTEIPSAASSVFYSYLGLTVGDLISGLLSQLLKSRKKAILYFIVLTTLCCVLILCSPKISLDQFYLYTFFLGFSVGYWAVFITTAAEQFGTNLRATVTTTVPNFVRGSVIPATILFKTWSESIGSLNSALIVGLICISIATIATMNIKESFAKDLDFLES